MIHSVLIYGEGELTGIYCVLLRYTEKIILIVLLHVITCTCTTFLYFKF